MFIKVRIALENVNCSQTVDAQHAEDIGGISLISFPPVSHLLQTCPSKDLILGFLQDFQVL